jgi:isopenicillin N synthase-like dioxygenase
MYVLTADLNQPDAREVFVKSLRETGFGVLKNHPIDYALIKAVFAEWEAFFHSETKMDYLFDREKHDGLFPMTISETAKGNTIKDIKEFYHYYPWGRRPPQITAKTQQLFDEMNALAATLLTWIEELTPPDIKAHFSVPLSSMIHDSPKTLLRVLHYPPFQGTEEPGAVRAAAHEDIDLLTVLPAATATGLQVKDAQGQWHDVVSDPGTMVVNVGDMLQLASRHYYRSTTHRVINPQGEEAKKSRLSMPLFLHARNEVQLTPEITAKEYWIERLKELGVY